MIFGTITLPLNIFVYILKSIKYPLPRGLLESGGWSDWTHWSACSTSCDIGVITRDRKCDNPIPSVGAPDCQGDSHMAHDCSKGPCPGL